MKILETEFRKAKHFTSALIRNNFYAIPTIQYLVDQITETIYACMQYHIISIFFQLSLLNQLIIEIF